ncbi:MAG: EF-P lysine aminoacylase EpmA [Acidobacteriota bacterium]
MCRGQRNSSGLSWQPTTSPSALRQRAELLATLRRFFADRGVMEVETPLLAAATVTDLHLASLSCRLQALAPGGAERYFLQTSPEYAMKRLLAAGSGPIYQICKAFRDGEAGASHNPEFTMLEWYRPGFDHHRLMDEMDALLAEALGVAAAERASYREVFERRLGLDPHCATLAELRQAATEVGVELAGDGPDDRDGWLHLLMSHAIEPHLGRGRPTFVFDFPASQAALARLRTDAGGAPTMAERFEVYVEGVELANGFHELADADEQRQRFEADLAQRRARGLEAVPIDERLLAALAAGLPDCAGVALGVDRLLMLRAGASELRQVISFPVDIA